MYDIEFIVEIIICRKIKCPTMRLYVWGFILLRQSKKPDWCRLKCNNILSVSNICTLHLDLTKCFFINYPEKTKKHIKLN